MNAAAPTQEAAAHLPHAARLHDNPRYQVLGHTEASPGTRIYRARDLHRQGQVVAIKRMDASYRPFEVFFKEVQFMQYLNRRYPTLGIPTALEWFTSTRARYLVMSFVPGSTLEEMLRSAGGPLPIEDVLSLGVSLCDTLQAFHSYEPAIIHRDVKPANVIRGPGGRVDLVDLGSATFANGRPEALPRGTWGYAPPEQRGGKPVTPASDVYSLGATLYELLTGCYPGRGMPLIKENAAGLPTALTHLLWQMTQKEVRHRIGTARAVKQELLALAAARAPEMALC
jgi:serine/threonine protein kinase